MKTCPFVKGPEEIEECYNKLVVDDAGEVCTALAVTLFPNLRTMTITDGTGQPLLGDLIERIAKASV